jgi:hypothetical protein
MPVLYMYVHVGPMHAYVCTYVYIYLCMRVLACVYICTVRIHICIPYVCMCVCVLFTDVLSYSVNMAITGTELCWNTQNGKGSTKWNPTAVAPPVFWRIASPQDTAE